MHKTPREEAAYIAGRIDAQVLMNILYAGTAVKVPDMSGTADWSTSEKCLEEAEKLKLVRKLVNERIENLIDQAAKLVKEETAA